MEKQIIFAVFGIPFLAMGLGCLASKQNRLLGVGCTLFGGCMMGLPKIMECVATNTEINIGELAFDLFGLLFIAIGMAMLFLAYRMSIYKLSRCTLEVEAIVKNKNTMVEDYNQMNSYGFEFYYGGRLYMVEDDMFLGANLEKALQEGEKIMIKIDPTNPECFYRSRPAAIALTVVFGVGFIFPGLLVLILV